MKPTGMWQISGKSVEVETLIVAFVVIYIRNEIRQIESVNDQGS